VQGVKSLVILERIAVVDQRILLDYPYEFFAWVVEVKLDLVTGTSDGFITSELKLFNKVFVWVLCHTSAFIGIEENVVNVQRSSNKRFVVSSTRSFLVRTVIISTCCLYSVQAFVKRTEFDVNLNFVVLKSDQGQSKTWVSAEPELKRNV